jgi:hypothetical protein
MNPHHTIQANSNDGGVSSVKQMSKSANRPIGKYRMSTTIQTSNLDRDVNDESKLLAYASKG